MNPKKSLKKRLKKTKWSVGDFYPGPEFEGRITEVGKDYLLVEHMDENGDVQTERVSLIEDDHKICDYLDSKEVYMLMEDLKDLVGVDKIYQEIFNYFSTDQIGDFYEHLKKVFDLDYVTDTTDVERAAEFAIDADKVIDLYLDGYLEVIIPSGVPSEEFKDEVFKLIYDLWDEPDVNFKYEKKDFSYVIEDGKLKIFVS